MSLSNTSTNNNSRNSVPSERLWLRSELMGTQVITTDTGRRLGVVGEVVVDIDREPPYTARVFAAGFDKSSNIFLGVSSQFFTFSKDTSVIF